MPAVKQGGGYTLTFSKKNEDVKGILADKQKNGFVITDYICEAIRFYEENKDKTSNVNKEDVEEMIRNILINKELVKFKDKDLETSVDEVEENLEENLDFVDTEED